MPDDLTKRGPADRNRVNIHEPWERKYWSNHFGVSEAELIAAVNAVGVMVADVKRKLGK